MTEDNQKSKNSVGKIEPRDITDEMSQSYLDYAMSVIVSRALPDVRDGLKPVHRRILHAMNEMGLRSRAKPTKSAKIVGEVMGKYHPHGDQAVYNTLARMVQNFSLRYPLIDGQGNFGSMDGDSPAAMRYTEAKMTAISEELLADIDKNTVDFIDNYDGSQKEPTYLPAKVPNLLLNGALGIAVGMATSIPPHNLRELIAGTQQLIDSPELSLEDLIKKIPGPDFPTGSTIYGHEDIVNAYATGKGSIVMRADTKIIENKAGGFQIIISAIPYQINKAELVVKIAQLVKNKKIEGISDIRDESDRTEAVRIVIELKGRAYPKKVLNQLYSLTPLQTTFNLNMIALQGGIQPRIYTLKEALLAFIEHRIEVVTKRTKFELNKAQDRTHILEGLKKALDKIDQIITTIRSSKTREDAQGSLIKKFNLTKIQADAILEMKLAALAGLERKKILDELAQKLKFIADLKSILASDLKIKAIVKSELDEVAQKYGDERKTKIIANRIDDFSAEDLIPNETVIITLTKGNYIKRVSVGAYKSQHRGGKGIVGMTTKEEDEVNILKIANTHDDILFFTSKGRLFKSKVYDLPAASRQAKGTPLVNIIQLAQDEDVTALITLNFNSQSDDKYFFMGTKNGVVKKTLVAAYANIRKTGIIAMKIRPEDELKWVWLTSGSNEILIVSQKGQSIRFDEDNVRPMGRSASGVRGMRLRAGDAVISLDIVKDPEQEFLFVVSRKGFGKRTKISLFTKQNRGGIGLRASRVTAKTGVLAAAKVVEGNIGEVVMVSNHGQTIRLPLKAVKSLGRDTQGVTLMRFRDKNDYVASMTVFAKSKAEQEAEQKQAEKLTQSL